MRSRLTRRRAMASLEFAVVAPVLITLTLAATDGARSLLIWRQLHNAANAIALNAEKLSVITDPNTNALASSLTADQMQQAMSTIYAEIPGLNLGNGGGLFPGKFAVTISEVEFTPICAQSSGCAAQSPYVLWSNYLSVGGSQLTQGVLRPCQLETRAAAFPDNASQYVTMVDPNLATGGNTMTVASQIVVDVQYTFTPYFPYFFKSKTFYASSAVASPVGGLDSVTTLNTTANTGNTVSCTYN